MEDSTKHKISISGRIAWQKRKWIKRNITVATIMENVAKEIIELKFKPDDTLQQCLNNFYKIMRKYGIKHGKKENNGIRMTNFEWTMCQSLFYDRIHSFFIFNKLIYGVPKDLSC
jgi:hypothetical protein